MLGGEATGLGDGLRWEVRRTVMFLACTVGGQNPSHGEEPRSRLVGEVNRVHPGGSGVGSGHGGLKLKRGV